MQHWKTVPYFAVEPAIPDADQFVSRAAARMRGAIEAVGALTWPEFPVAEESVTVRRDPVPLSA